MERKVALVTGASGNGIGRSIALTLAREGFAVVVNYLNNQLNANEVVRSIIDHGGNAIAIRANVFVKEDCVKLVTQIINHFGTIDICILNPGANWNAEPLMNLKSDLALQDVVQEISPLYYLLPLVLKDMGLRKWGRIIGMASNMDIPSPSYAYNTAKLSRINALKLAVPHAWQIGVTVNIIAPGPVNGFSNLSEAENHCYHSGEWTERKQVTPQDIAEGVAFLCSNSARYITGCVLPYNF